MFDNTMYSDVSEPTIAGVGLRACAFLIDMAVFFASFFASGVIVVLCGAVSESAVRVVWPVSLLAVLAFAMWNLGVRQGGVRAASFGKSAMGLLLVDADSLIPVGRGRGVLRCVLRPVDMFFAVGLLHALVDAENRTVVDRIVRTLVIHG